MKCGTILRAGDALLLGTDLEKSVGDPSWLMTIHWGHCGVRFEFAGADQSGAWRRISIWDISGMWRAKFEERRIEMHLRSTAGRAWKYQGRDARSLEEGETFWTESSHKYRTRSGGDGGAQGLSLRSAVGGSGVAVRAEFAY